MTTNFEEKFKHKILTLDIMERVGLVITKDQKSYLNFWKTDEKNSRENLHLLKLISSIDIDVDLAGLLVKEYGDE